MQTLVISVFLLIVLGLFSLKLQLWLQHWFQQRPTRIFVVPAALAAFFCAVLAQRDGLSLPFALVLAAYTLVPTALIWANGPGEERRAWPDFAAILLLWIPVEFTAGKSLLPPQAHSLAVNAAKGTAVALALFLFLIFRSLKGMKYNLPRNRADFWNPLLGFMVAAPILVFLGLRLSFLGPFRVLEDSSAAGFVRLFAITLAGVAIPEELLFRSLIQNRLMQQFGESNEVLLAAALIFGAAHLNNGPGPLPNWRYMLLATIAGFIYGKVFQRSGTILSSASLHALVNTVRHTSFG